MTLEDASKQYAFPIDTLKEYVSSGLIKGGNADCNKDEYCDADFKHLGLMETLRSAGFTNEEIKKYLRLTEQKGTDEEQIRMLRKRRAVLLCDIHKVQQLLDTLDYMIWQKKDRARADKKSVGKENHIVF